MLLQSSFRKKGVVAEGKKGVLRPAIILSVATFIAKLLGAIYRIPLTNLIGAEGLGLYQMIFPVYCILLDFSGAGAPNALSKLIAEKKDSAHHLLYTSLKMFFSLGIIATVLMVVLSYPLAFLQGNVFAVNGYVFLAPSVLLVSLISCYRGYFQGQLNTMPTAISQVAEQVVKLIVGLFLAYMFMPNIPLAVGGATLGVTVSEVFAFLIMLIAYKKGQGRCFPVRIEREERRVYSKSILKYVIPISVIAIASPIAHLTDSFIVVNILSNYRQDATSLYGILSGTVCSVVNLPVALCYGISIVAIPWISGGKNSTDKNKKSNYSILLTAIFSIPCVIGLFVLAPWVINILFHGLSDGQSSLASGLLKVSSINVLLLSLLQTVNAILIGRGKPYNALIGLGVGIIFRVVANLVLLPMPSLNIYGSAIASITCNFFATLINLIQALLIGRKERLKKDLLEVQPSR